MDKTEPLNPPPQAEELPFMQPPLFSSSVEANTPLARKNRAEKLRKQRENNRQSAGLGAASSTKTGKKRKRVDPLDEQEKKRRRLVRNRAAAQSSRERKKRYIKKIEVENDDYKKRIEALDVQNANLRDLLKFNCPEIDLPVALPPPPHADESIPMQRTARRQVVTDPGRVDDTK